jgi:hypothetical protein
MIKIETVFSLNIMSKRMLDLWLFPGYKMGQAE